MQQSSFRYFDTVRRVTAGGPLHMLDVVGALRVDILKDRSAGGDVDDLHPPRQMPRSGILRTRDCLADIIPSDPAAGKFHLARKEAPHLK